MTTVFTASPQHYGLGACAVEADEHGYNEFMNALSCRVAVAMAILPWALLAQPAQAPKVLPATASAQLARSLEAAAPHARHVWRDSMAVNPDGTVNGYIEIS